MQSADEQLYVLVLSDGQYASVYTPMTHGANPKERVTPTTLNQATARFRFQWKDLLKYGALVPVKVERKVTIIPG